MSVTLFHYRACVDDFPSITIVCSTCNSQSRGLDAITPYGVVLRMENLGWRRLDPNWYTLWQCSYCWATGVEPHAPEKAKHFGKRFTSPYAVHRYQGFRIPRGRMRAANGKAKEAE
jgi:hypothetical protein